MSSARPPRRQDGVVLVVALLLLMLTGLLAATMAESNLLQLRMAGNEQDRATALQGALAVVDGVLDAGGNLPVRGPVGHRLCPAGLDDRDCDETILVIDPQLLTRLGAVNFEVVRQAPLEQPLPFVPESRASSGRYFRGALFEVTARVASPGRGTGATVSQGVLLRVSPAQPWGTGD